MNGKYHFKFYIFSIIVLFLFNEFIYTFIENRLLFLYLIPFFVINPDLDFSMFNSHRNFITHSLILPLMIYLPFREFLSDNTNYRYISILLFFPVIIHLIGDFKFSTISKALVGDLKEILIDKKLNSGSNETLGTWRITFRPFINKTLGFYQTIIWVFVNIILMIIIIVFQ